MSLRAKLFWGVSIVVVLSLFLAMVFSTLVVNSLFKSAVLQPAVGIASVEALRAQRKLKETRSFLHSIIPFVEGKIELGLCPIPMLQSMAAKREDIESLYLLLNKSVNSELGSDCVEGLLPGDMAKDWGTEDKGTFSVGRLNVDPLTGRKVIPVFYPLSSGEGALVATVSLRWLEDDMEILPSFVEGMVMVDSKGGCSLFLPEENRNSILHEDREAFCKELGEKLFKERVSIASPVSLYSGGRMIKVFLHRIPPAELFEGTVVTKSQIFESKEATIIIFILFITVGLFIVVLLVNIAVNPLVGRMDRMVRFADTIASGRYTVRIEECGKDELGHLCHALNIMAQCLEDYERRYSDAQLTLRKMYEEKKSQAERDLLTGLYNHGKLYETLESEVKRVNRYGGGFSVVLFDLNYFKEINDTYGHLIGDEALKIFARVLKENSRETDVVGRYGGDEFMMILPNASADEAGVVVERVLNRVKETPLVVDGQEIVLQVSVGVAGYSSGDCEGGSLTECVNLLVSRADEAMYRHKRELKTQRWREEGR